MPNTQENIDRLYQICRIVICSILFLLAASVVMVFVNQNMILPFLFLALILHLTILRPAQKRFSDAFTKENILRTVAPKIATDQVERNVSHYITESLLRQAELMPCGEEKSKPLLCWELHGTINGMQISLCDVTIPQAFRLSAKGKHRIHFNSGVWIHIELPSDSTKRFRLLDETSVPTPIRMDYFAKKPEYETASVGDPALAQRFVLYRKRGSNQHPAPAFIHSLKALVSYTPGYIALSIEGDQFDVFIRGRFLSAPVSISKKPDQDMLSFDPFPELDYLIKLADSLLP